MLNKMYTKLLNNAHDIAVKSAQF